MAQTGSKRVKGMLRRGGKRGWFERPGEEEEEQKVTRKIADHEVEEVERVGGMLCDFRRRRQKRSPNIRTLVRTGDRTDLEQEKAVNWRCEQSVKTKGEENRFGEEWRI